MVHNAAGTQLPEKIHGLFDRNGVSNADIHAATLLKRTSTVDSNQLTTNIEKRPTRVTRVDGSIGLNAIAIFENRTTWVLVSTNTTNQTIRDGGLEIGGQHKWVSCSKAPLSNSDLVAIA